MAFSKLWRKKLILAALEGVGTYGSDAAPSAAADAILASNVSLRTMADEVAREFDRPYLGGRPVVLVAKRVELEFDVELAGSGTAGTAPAWGRLLVGCGMGETVTALTDVTYAPLSAAFDSISFYVWLEGQRYRILGARGSFSITKSIRQFPVIRFRFVGLLEAPTDVALPSPTYAQISPVAVEKETWDFDYDATAHEADSLEFDMANTVEIYESSESIEVCIVDRNPTGSIRLYAPDVATYAWLAKADALTQAALSSVIGTVAGNIATLTAPKVQPSYPDPGELNGNVGYTIPLKFLPDTGNDELELVLT